MGNCCGKKEKTDHQKVKPEDQSKIQYQQKSPEIVKKQKIPVLPKKKRVKETVKLVQSKDANGKKILNEYLLEETLGQGAYGKVKKATKKNDKSSTEYAIKILKKLKLKKQREFVIDKDGKRTIKTGLDKLKKEIAIMKKLHHENVIKLYEVIDNEEGEKIYMVIDYASRGQIIDWDEEECIWYFTDQKYKDGMNEEFLRKILRDCVKGLNYLHKHQIVHRDIKPQNILFNHKMQAMMADFGVSTMLQNENDKMDNTEGSYYFMSPEALNKETSSQGYSGKLADIWALGISFYCFAFQIQPNFKENVYEYMDSVQVEEIQYPQEHEYSNGFINLLKQMLEKDPSKRITIDQIAQNEWINENQPQSLQDELKINQLEEITDEDIQNALQISTVVRIKQWVQKWKSERKLSQNSRLSMENSNYTPENKFNQSNTQNTNEKDVKHPMFNKELQNSNFLNPNYVNTNTLSIDQN